MASSVNSDDPEPEIEEDEVDASRFVVSADQMRTGEFATLDELREEIVPNEE